jgi:hypothetical protein
MPTRANLPNNQQVGMEPAIHSAIQSMVFSLFFVVAGTLAGIQHSETSAAATAWSI